MLSFIYVLRNLANSDKPQPHGLSIHVDLSPPLEDGYMKTPQKRGVFFDGFEKNSKYIPNTSLIAESTYAITANGISAKIYPTKILMVQIIPRYIIDFPCTK